MAPPDAGASAATKFSLAWGPFGIGKVLDYFGIHSWADYSYAVAGVLSTLMVADFLWKKWKARK